jgi:hypothetical protein
VDAAKVGSDGEKYIRDTTVAASSVKGPSQYPLFLSWPLFWFP